MLQAVLEVREREFPFPLSTKTEDLRNILTKCTVSFRVDSSLHASMQGTRRRSVNRNKEVKCHAFEIVKLVSNGHNAIRDEDIREEAKQEKHRRGQR
jgi:hypothetical protein